MKAFIDDIASVFRKDIRLTELREIAQKHRWSFARRLKLNNQSGTLQQFDLFKGQRGKRLIGVLRLPSAKKTYAIRIYDYTYFGNFSNTSTTVFEFKKTDWKLPMFSIRPKGTFATLKKMFLPKPFLLATTPDFDANYEITGADEAKIKAKLSLNFLDEVGDETGWTYEGKSDYLIVYQIGKQLEKETIIKELPYLEKLAKQLS